MSFYKITSIDNLIIKESSLNINEEISILLKELSDVQDNIWKGTAYQKASRIIQDLDKPITEYEDLQEIPGIGHDIAQEITEYLETGKIEKLEKFRSKFDIRGRRYTREQILSKTKKFFDAADDIGLKFVITGSVRRKAKMCKDIDAVVLLEQFEKWDKLVDKLSDKVVRSGEQEVDFIYNRIGINIRAVESSCFGAGLLYFSGSNHFLIYLRQIAKSLGYKLNRYGLFNKAGKNIACATEKEIFKALKLPYIPPEER
jgi:DNA polymerase (family 10)